MLTMLINTLTILTILKKKILGWEFYLNTDILKFPKYNPPYNTQNHNIIDKSNYTMN